MFIFSVQGRFSGGLWSLEGSGQGVLADSHMTKPPSKTLAHMNGGLKFLRIGYACLNWVSGGETVNISRGVHIYVGSSPEQGASLQSDSEAFLLV